MSSGGKSHTPDSILKVPKANSGIVLLFPSPRLFLPNKLPRPGGEPRHRKSHPCKHQFRNSITKCESTLEGRLYKLEAMINEAERLQADAPADAIGAATHARAAVIALCHMTHILDISTDDSGDETGTDHSQPDGIVEGLGELEKV